MTTRVDGLPDPVLSPQEKQDRLNELTDKYFRGDIELEDFLQQRNRYSLDFEAFIAELALRQSSPSLPEGERYLEDMRRRFASLEQRESPFLYWLRRTLSPK